jgi:hypothetical protein
MEGIYYHERGHALDREWMGIAGYIEQTADLTREPFQKLFACFSESTWHSFGREVFAYAIRFDTREPRLSAALMSVYGQITFSAFTVPRRYFESRVNAAPSR